MMPEDRLFRFLAKLDTAKIHYRLGRSRDDTVMVEAHVPGERWEIEFFEDGEIEVEIFRSDGSLRGADALEDLFRRFSD